MPKIFRYYYGTREGGLKAKKANIAKHGEGFYSKIGAKGGRMSCNGGFASTKVGEDGLTGIERAKIAGAKGGKKSTRAGIRNGFGKTTRNV